MLVEKAIRYATSAHARLNHVRKYSLEPYDVHLKAVAGIIASVTDDEEMIAAAWLHDTVEDTPATFEDLEREFGLEVANLVKELTDVSRPGDGNRAARKAIDRQHVAAASARAKTIKLADLIDNCSDICRHDPEFGRVYLKEMQALMEVLTEGDQGLYARALETLATCKGNTGFDAAMLPDDAERPALSAAVNRLLPGHHGIRLFTAAFAARDIQEPLLSFDAETLQEKKLGDAGELQAPVVGIRQKGVVVGYVLREDLSPGSLMEPRRFDPGQLLDLESSLTDVIHVLTNFSRCFVTLDGTVIGVIGRKDIDKPVVRMWLFGIIILLETLVVNFIRHTWPDGGWSAAVSEGRLDKARQLQAERKRRGFTADLLDCLQFSDKLQIALREPLFLQGTGFPTGAEARRALKDLESLRNNLAHGQDIASHNWLPIVRLARRILQLYGM